jgi:hypothetical protein
MEFSEHQSLYQLTYMHYQTQTNKYNTIYVGDPYVQELLKCITIEDQITFTNHSPRQIYVPHIELRLLDM